MNKGLIQNVWNYRKNLSQHLSILDKESIDDMRDGEDIGSLPYPLGQIITYIHTALFEKYSEYDTSLNSKTEIS